MAAKKKRGGGASRKPAKPRKKKQHQEEEKGGGGAKRAPAAAKPSEMPDIPPRPPVFSEVMHFTEDGAPVRPRSGSAGGSSGWFSLFFAVVVIILCVVYYAERFKIRSLRDLKNLVNNNVPQVWPSTTPKPPSSSGGSGSTEEEESDVAKYIGIFFAVLLAVILLVYPALVTLYTLLRHRRLPRRHEAFPLFFFRKRVRIAKPVKTITAGPALGRSQTQVLDSALTQVNITGLGARVDGDRAEYGREFAEISRLFDAHKAAVGPQPTQGGLVSARVAALNQGAKVAPFPPGLFDKIRDWSAGKRGEVYYFFHPTKPNTFVGFTAAGHRLPVNLDEAAFLRL